MRHPTSAYCRPPHTVGNRCVAGEIQDALPLRAKHRTVLYHERVGTSRSDDYQGRLNGLRRAGVDSLQSYPQRLRCRLASPDIGWIERTHWIDEEHHVGDGGYRVFKQF